MACLLEFIDLRELLLLKQRPEDLGLEPDGENTLHRNAAGRSTAISTRARLWPSSSPSALNAVSSGAQSSPMPGGV